MCPELNFGNFERPPARQRVLACAQALVANVCSSRASQHSTFCFFSTPGTFKYWCSSFSASFTAPCLSRI